MTVNSEPAHQRGLHPLHAVLLAGTVPLFLGALLCDIAYASSYQIQWSNFASWLIAGGLLFAGCAVVWAIVDLIRAERRGGHRLVYLLVLLAVWILGFINALHHARDAWGIMPAGLVMSALVVVLAGLAIWIGFWNLRAGGRA